MRTRVSPQLKLLACARAPFAVIVSVGAITVSCGSDSDRPAFTPSSDSAEDASPAPPPLEGGDALSACDEARVRTSPLGCEYLVFPIPDGTSTNEGCTALFISNPSERAARIEISRDGKPFDVALSARRVSSSTTHEAVYEPLDDAELPPGASAVVALHESAGPQEPISEALGKCPFSPLVDESKTGFRWMGDVAAFHVKTSEPVFATYAYPYAYSWSTGSWKGTAGSSTALRSAGSWTTSNVDIGMFIPGRPLQQHERDGSPIAADLAAFLALGSAQDTTVTLTGSEGTEDVKVPAGHVIRVKRDDRFIGSRVTSSSPIAVFVGARQAQFPYNFGESNPILDQVPSPDSWGSEYVAVRYPDRYAGVSDAAIYRIIGDADGTHLTYEPARPEAAPETIKAGELVMFMSASPFIVRSQDDAHRFHMTIAMTGSEYVQPDESWRTATGRGGPELMNLTPRRDFARRFAFMTEHTYSDVHLVLVRAKENGSFHPVTLACAGEVNGWVPLGSSGDYETAVVTISAGNYEAQVYSGGTCHNGPHTVKSDGPLTGYVWAWVNERATSLDPPEAGGGSVGYALYGLPEITLPTGR